MILESPHWNNKTKLLKDIQIVSFALDDVKLFLDTHPNDKNALHYFGYYKEVLETMVDKYNENFGALTALESNTENSWEWIENPWPWEMED